MGLEYLKQIVENKKKLIAAQKEFYASLKKQLDSTEYNRYGLFKKCISKADRINLIAEIKKASPSQGVIREDFDLMGLARTYAQHKADAISVLTEEKYFLGKPAYVKRVSDAINLPVLMKDFFIDEGQIYEARYQGASAILLIAAILDDAKLKKLYKKACALDMDCLVEVHDKKELKRVLKLGAQIIGVNNRNLKTFKVDLKTSEELIPLIPKDKVIVAESGIQSHEDVLHMGDLGANAVLIGEAFMREQDVGKKIKDMMNG